MKQFVVIGCGMFGTSVATSLYNLGHEVLAIDHEEERVAPLANRVTHAVIADVQTEGVLKDLGVQNFDVCVVALSSNFEASVMCTVEAKDLGIKEVIVKAKDDLHARVLKRIGADKVIIPERDMGERIAHNLSSHSIIDFIQLSDDFSMVEISSPSDWHNKTIEELDIRKNYGLNIVGIKRGRDMNINPDPETVLQEEDKILVVGKDREIESLVEGAQDE